MLLLDSTEMEGCQGKGKTRWGEGARMFAYLVLTGSGKEHSSPEQCVFPLPVCSTLLKK